MRPDQETAMPKFLALYTGSPPADGQPQGPPDDATIAKGMAAWGAWMGQHASAIVDSGGPLGKTKKVSAQGVADTRNNAAGYVVVEAPSHEAAAKMFEGHPHFAIFPGDGVEVMPVLPIPGS
jgi:hypothetical protein